MKKTTVVDCCGSMSAAEVAASAPQDTVYKCADADADKMRRCQKCVSVNAAGKRAALTFARVCKRGKLLEERKNVLPKLIEL